jgi:protein-S-isoprenylcysteine O-methyltransferase Ste14
VRSVAVLIAFFVTWSAVHSLLASQAVKQRVRERFGHASDRWYRVAFVALTGLTLWPVVPLLLFLPDQVLYVIPSPWSWLMRAGQVLSMAGIAGAVVQVGFLRFVGLAQLFGSSSTDSGPAQTKRLEVSKFYACVRHPMFLCGVILMWLNPTMTLNLATSFGMTSLYLVAGTFVEESKTLMEFGESFREYRRRVPRLIVRPGRCIRAWRHGTGPGE